MIRKAAPATRAVPAQAPDRPAASWGKKLILGLLTQRLILLAVLVVIVLVAMSLLDANGYLTAPYDADYLAASLINAVPLAMLGLAQMLVILSGRGGIDLSVGAIVSLTGIIFGFAYGPLGLPLPIALLITVLAGAAAGAVNGLLVATFGFPALIATLATFYAYKSLALVVSGQRPISSPSIQDFYSAARPVEIPLIGGGLPNVPLGVFTFLIPVVLIVWIVVNKTTFGRQLYAIGTNDIAARWAGLPADRTRFFAYLLSGVISSLVAVVTVAQFASARPDAGVSGNGMALPAITIAVLGGVAITGGIGRVGGIVLATLLIVWLNAGILLAFEGNDGTQFQFLALGVILLAASLLNTFATRFTGEKS